VSASPERLRAGLDELVGRLAPGQVEVLRLEDPLGCAFELRIAAGEPILIRDRAPELQVEFGGWIEIVREDEEGMEEGEALALTLDFVAAALFGELRVELIERRGEVLARVLWVRVDDHWRSHALRGRRTFLRRTSSRMIIHAIARPRSLRERGPTGLPRAPWSGAGGVGWIASAVEAKPLVIDGELDLHDFPPREVAALVREYIEQCRARGIRDLRIVHGKGIGALRRTVHALLAEHPDVESWRLGGHAEGSWGATIVRLRA
jgi:hypothetical protein